MSVPDGQPDNEIERAQRIVRGKGMCGEVVNGERICIKDPGHDGGHDYPPFAALPAGLREALTEAAAKALLEMWHERDDPAEQQFLVDAAEDYAPGFVDVLAPTLVSWLAVHDAEVRQQGRNEAARAIEEEQFRTPSGDEWAEGYAYGLQTALDAVKNAGGSK